MEGAPPITLQCSMGTHPQRSGGEDPVATPPLGAAPTGMGIPRRLALVVLVAALVPAGWTLFAPWIAEDTAILGHVARNPWWQDWVGPQYGVRLVLFWRPLVTSAWGLQAQVLGTEPALYRALNLAAHAGCALLVLRLLLQLGVYPLAALLGALATAFFPEQGGTVTWISGRTDLFGALGILACLSASFSKRWRLAAPLAFLACASKEFAFLLPGWVLLLHWAAGETRRTVLQRTAVVFVGCVLAFLARRFALGTFGGGYAAQLPAPLEGIVGCARALRSSWHPSVLCLLPMLVLGGLWGSLSGRMALASIGVWILGLAPLYPLLADGHLEDQNVRLYFVSDLGVALLVGASLARLPLKQNRTVTLVALAFALLLWRGWGAFRDASEWSRAAHEAGRQEEAARAIVGGTESSPMPVWIAGFPRSFEGAYCLGWGLTERFRSPFAETPRPIWPWRSVSAFSASERAPRSPLRADGSLWPTADPPQVPLLRVGTEGASAPEALVLDERVLQPDPALAPALVWKGAYPGAVVEALVYTPLGYEAVGLGAAGEQQQHRLSLKTLLEKGNGVYSIAGVLQQSADLGALNAFVEIRVLNRSGEMLAVSPLIELVWDADFLRLSLGDR